MANQRAVYLGPRLRRLRRELGLKQSDMAEDLGISPSYVALLERNQRPLTADMLLRLARTYKLDVADLASDEGSDHGARLQAVLKDPMFADIDIPALEAADVATNYTGITEALLRLYTAYSEEQLALADSAAAQGRDGTARGAEAADPLAEVRRFLGARRNSFPALDETAERLAGEIATLGAGVEGFAARLKTKHNVKVRRWAAEAMGGLTRRFDMHRDTLFVDDGLDGASHRFQLALQLAYLELRGDIDAVLKGGSFDTEGGLNLARRALASYAAAALLMPYSAFARAVEAQRYDVEALARQFATSFEQTAHRLTTLQKPGEERVPFFFIRVDQAGNVSKRLDGAGFPFARHGGACPLWSVHQAFRTPGEVVTQWIELPDGQRFFSIARTVTAGGGGFDRPRIDRSIALGCAAEHAHKLIYAQGDAGPRGVTPIGVSCRLCHRTACAARSAPPIGRQILPNDYLGGSAPFLFADD
jgi:predicted transcriptional regulator/DNA-binding XRE family transcriptional regulator